MKKYLLLFLLFIVIAGSFIYFQTKQGRIVASVIKTKFVAPNYVNKEGGTIRTRVVVPEGFELLSYTEGSFQQHIQNYALKEHTAKVINYDNTPYFYQNGHFGVLTLPVPSNGLQQCADALIRLRAEYLWEHNKKDAIGFKFTSGHYCSWKNYAAGYRPKINGNKVSFHKTASANSSKANFYEYLTLIFTYSGTLSLYNELPKITKISNLKVGDMLIHPGTPGHVIMIATIIKNENGKRKFILMQGNTPAQSVHLLKNSSDGKMNPWYDMEIGAPVEIPGYYFETAKFMRFKD